MNNLDKKKIVLGLSGGVDSTTAALILKNKGFEVIGFYFDITGCNEKALRDAKNVASQLDIKLIYKDVSKEFNDIVIGDFCQEYINGRTPNPCIKCNPTIKFKHLLDVANEEGAYYIATGHYAGIHHDENTGLYYIKTGKNSKKDQSYMLYRLGQDVLSRLIFPLYDVEDKEETREYARSFNMNNSEQKDSQEICFVDQTSSYIEFLKSRGYVSKPGDFIDKEGHTLGTHQGIINYTIGQRKGLGIALGKPAFVTKIDSTKNEVILGDNEDLMSHKVISSNNFFVDINRTDYSNIKAKIRYTTLPQEAKIISKSKDEVITNFTTKQRAATPGQSIVFYDGDLVIGGGIIE